MAKLEEQITPEELLADIRAGTLKSEIIKQYKTSDQELAMMLLPLYRSQEMSKEEFNNFFKGIPLTEQKPEPAPVKPPEAERQPPQQKVEEIPVPDDKPTAVPDAGNLSASMQATLDEAERQKTPPAAKPGPGPKGKAPRAHKKPAIVTSPEPSLALEGIDSLCRTILTRLDIIDSRLSKIERRLGTRRSDVK
jgi:hypothetical protein